MKNTSIEYAEPYRTGGELFRIIIHQYDESKKLMGTYEIWATQEAIEDELEIAGSPSRKQLSEYGARIFEKWMDETDNQPEQNGLFAIKKDDIRYGDYNTFPGSVWKPEPMVRTNISLPQSLYKWLRVKSAKSNKSISELIRQSIVNYKRKA